MPTRPTVHHAQGHQSRAQFNKARAPAHAVAYDYQWRKLSKRFLLMNPLCIDCLAEGIINQATETDHVVPIRDAPDRRLDWSNLAPRCKLHHSKKTYSETLRQ